MCICSHLYCLKCVLIVSNKRKCVFNAHIIKGTCFSFKPSERGKQAPLAVQIKIAERNEKIGEDNIKQLENE